MVFKGIVGPERQKANRQVGIDIRNKAAQRFDLRFVDFGDHLDSVLPKFVFGKTDDSVFHPNNLKPTPNIVIGDYTFGFSIAISNRCSLLEKLLRTSKLEQIINAQFAQSSYTQFPVQSRLRLIPWPVYPHVHESCCY